MDHNVNYSQSEGWRSSNNSIHHKRSNRMKPRPHTASLRRNDGYSTAAGGRRSNINNKRPSTAVGLTSMNIPKRGSINRQRSQSYQQETEEDIEFGRTYLKNLRIINSPRSSFDAGHRTHPVGTMSIPRKLPISPAKRRPKSSNNRKNKKKETQAKNQLGPVVWGLGRQFTPAGLSKEELQDSIFRQWINGYNDEKTEYRSASVEIDTSFANANVFTEGMPPANTTIISVALSNFDKLIQICGRYRRQLNEIRTHLLKAIYIDHKSIPNIGDVTIEAYAKTPTYFASSADLAVELEVTKFQLQQITEQHANTKDNAAKHKRTSFARMFMHAADKSKHSKKTSELEAKLQVHDDHMHKLHTKTYEMIVNLLIKLEPAEQLNLIETIFKQFNLDDTKAFLLNFLKNHKDFDEVERGEFITKLMSAFMEDTLLEVVKKQINGLGGRSKSSVLFDIITKQLSASVRQAIIVDILLADTSDRTAIFSNFFKLVEKDNTFGFITFVMDNLFGMQEEKVKVCGKLLKYCIGIAPDEANLKHFAYDIVEEISSNRGTSNEINNVQTAILEELIKRCGTKLFRNLSNGKRQQLQKRKSEKLKKKKEEEKQREKEAEAKKVKSDANKTVKKVAAKRETKVGEDSKECDDIKSLKEETSKVEEEEKKMEHLETRIEKVEELIVAEEAKKVVVAQSDSDDDEDFADFLAPKKVETRTIETQTDPLPDIISSLNATGEGRSNNVVIEKNVESRIVKDMRPFAAVLQFEKKEGKPLTYHKTLAMIYTTYANKIMADKTADRNKLGRESIGNFITRSFKNEFGLDKRVSLMLAGLIKSINKFKSRSRRIEQFSELCGLALDQEYSAKTCDIYLNIVKTVFPKFNKVTLVKQVEGECKITHATAKKALHRVFPKKKKVKFSVGRLKLREDIFDDLKQTIKRIATPKVDFDVMIDCCLEASIRQFSINVEILKDMFVHYKKDDHDHLHRENFDELMQMCAEGITMDELDKIWEETHQYKTGSSESETLNPEIFSHICSKHGIAPPTEWRPPVVLEEEKEEVVETDSDEKGDNFRKKRGSSFGVLSAGFKLKSISRKMKERMQIPLISRMCQIGNSEEVERLLEEEADINEKDHRGTTPLMHAAWWGHLKIVEILVKSGADLDLRNGRWNTALHFAYEEKHEEIIKFLVDAGAASMKNKIGIVPKDFLKTMEDDEDEEENDDEDDDKIDD